MCGHSLTTLMPQPVITHGVMVLGRWHCPVESVGLFQWSQLQCHNMCCIAQSQLNFMCQEIPARMGGMFEMLDPWQLNIAV